MAEKGFSVSHMANGATRLQPLILNLGQVAGLAAAMAVRQGCAVGDLAVDAIQSALIHEPQAPAAVLPIWDWPPLASALGRGPNAGPSSAGSTECEGAILQVPQAPI